MTPVVFVHGFLGGSRQWQAQVEALSGIDVIAVDLPGYGENAHLSPLGSISAFAAWVLDALRSRGIARFNLIGHSMGGMIVQEMMAQAPDCVERLVLYGTGATGVLPGRFETIETSKQRAQSDGAQATARRIAATWFLETCKADAYEDCAHIAEQSGLGAILAGLEAMESWNGTNRLQEIRNRTLIVWGDRDRTYPWRQTEYLWQSIAGSSLAVLPDCAHAAHLEKPYYFNRLLKDFICN